jgi:hypothetical protein
VDTWKKIKKYDSKFASPTGSPGDCVLGGKICVLLLSLAGRRPEGREVAGNGESLRNVSSREGWANGARMNAQTRALVRGEGKKIKEGGLGVPPKKTLIPTPDSKSLFSGFRKLTPVRPTKHTPTNPQPYQAMDRYDPQLFLG